MERQPKPDLTLEGLAMPRTRIALPDRMIRVFNGRGAVAVRDRTVTGLQGLQFPPHDLPGYQFQLALVEQTSGAVIQDAQADVYEDYLQQLLATDPQGELMPHPLGLNCFSGVLPSRVQHIAYASGADLTHRWILLLQNAEWQPNRYCRTGTFHKRVGSDYLSLGIQTVTQTSATDDEILMEVRIQNRDDQPLRLMVVPDQRVMSRSPQGGGWVQAAEHPDKFTLCWKDTSVTVTSTLQVSTEQGWVWHIEPQSAERAGFSLSIGDGSAGHRAAPPPERIFVRIQDCEQAARNRLAWAQSALPEISTNLPKLDEFYNRCIETVLECRWDRENFAVRPFYAVGSWLSTLAWDTSFASKMLAILDPSGLRKAIVAYVDMGIMEHSWLAWDNRRFRWYAQSPFALAQIIDDYLRQTGDTQLLDQTINQASVLEWLKRAGVEMHRRFARSDGLFDFGPGSEIMLELRTDGYEHVVAAANGLAARYYLRLADWSQQRRDSEVATFAAWARQIEDSMTRVLWNEQIGWLDNLDGAGRRQTVLSYHLFDVLDGGILPDYQRRRLVDHLSEGEFLARNGLYSISPTDTVHFDQEDADWGGGGQYVGMPLRLSETLYRLGYAKQGWEILSRCLRWTESFPYFPQEIFAEQLATPGAEMPLELAAGSGVQAMVHGLFGVEPSVSGRLTIRPQIEKALRPARLVGYQYRGHRYDVTVESSGDGAVYRDGQFAKPLADGDSVRLG